MSNLLIRIETHAQKSTPPEKEVSLDGWHIRATGGRTKRFNSVNFRGEQSGQIPWEEKLSKVEAFYEARQQVPLFRITPLATPENLPDQLKHKGYIAIDQTDILAQSLPKASNSQANNAVEITSVLNENWLVSLARLTGKNEEQRRSFEEMLTRLEIQPLFAAYMSGDQITSIGFATIDDGILGLFEFATAENFRRRGEAEAVVNALLAEASKKEVKTAYLQVVGANEAGQAFWRHMGFDQYICTYYYMHRPAE